MFYRVSARAVPEQGPSVAVVVLTSAESKRLLGRAVASLPEVQRARQKGRLLISNGTTNAFVAEEILGIPVPKFSYAAGVITDGLLSITDPARKQPPYMLHNGQMVTTDMRDFLKEMGRGDVIIKGANAVDQLGNAGVLVAGDTGGSIGAILGISAARGLRLLTPVGLEKLIPSVAEAAPGWGQLDQQYTNGLHVGLMAVVNVEVITEIQALAILAGVEAIHIAGGGVGGSEGSVVLLLRGDKETVDRGIEVVKAVKGEPPVPKDPHFFSGSQD